MRKMIVLLGLLLTGCGLYPQPAAPLGAPQFKCDYTGYGIRTCWNGVSLCYKTANGIACQILPPSQPPTVRGRI